MEWQQLLGFRSLARLGSFTKAAEATCRSQSALSQQIRALEEELDVLLVERIGKRRLALTPAGERLLAFADQVVERYEGFLADLAQLKGRPAGRLRLAAPFTTLYHLFGPLIKEYTAKYPHVRLTVLDRPQPVILEMVRRGEVDLGVARQSAVPKDLTALGWLKLETLLMVPKGHPLSRKRRLAWRDIARYPLILPPAGAGLSARGEVEARLKKEGLAYHVLLESANVELSALYVEMGLGISFATLAENLTLPGRNLAFLPLGRSFPRDRLAVVRRRDKELPGYGRDFLTLLLAPAGEGMGFRSPEDQ